VAGTQQHTSAQKGSAAADKQAAHAPGVRGWIAAHRLISAVAAVLVFVAMPLVGLLLFTPAEKQEGPVTLAVALAALDRGDLEQARRMAERLIDGAALADDERGGPPYIFGVAASQQADSLLDQNRASLSLVAARHLEDARDLGFPHGREAAGLWLLGRNLYRAGQLAASAEPLEAALTLNPQHSSAIHPWLAEAYQAGEKPDLVRALEHSKTWLDDPQLFDEQRQQGLLQQGVILFKQQKFAECRQVLRQIATKAPQYSEALIVEGRMLLAEGLATKDSTASADKEKLSQAIEVFQRSRNEGSAKDQVALCAAYLIGLCYEHLSDRRAALEHYAQAGQGDRPESIAAMMHAAELLLEEGRQAEAVEAYRGALGEIRSPATDNPWLPLEELRSRATNAYLRLLEKGAFELARSLLEGWHPAFDRMRQIQLQAQTHRAWAIALKDQVDDLPAAEAAAQRGAIEQQFRLAGQLYSRLAELRFAHRQYPDDLWDAIESFSMAHDYPAAIKVLETYLEHEPVRRRAEALQRLGEAMLVEGRTDDAIQTLRQSVEFDPKNAASYRSKILASKALVDAGDLAGAEVLLLENIQSEYLTPASIEWRETLFQLGRLLHLEQRYSDAIERLEEAVARYPEDRQSTLAHYLIADGYRQQAKEISTELEKTVVESARLALGREMHRLLEGAITHYDQAMARLQSPVEASASQEPAEAQATILRNCHFMKGAALFDLGRYDEAIRAYSSATNRYQHEPEVLDAYVKVADCYRRLNRLSEARGTIEQAKVVLNRMPGDVSFADKSNFDRQEWARHLEWLSGVY
jgi:tetratricopeptide (TPR) repeat protein